MIAIAAVDKNWAIGRQGALLVSIPADQKNFRNLTMGKTVILGRKTLATFPGGRPLAGRRNIILTRDKAFSAPGALIAHSVEEAAAMAREDGTPEDGIFVIGGSSVYSAMLPYCDKAITTKIDLSYEADAYFPNLDAMDDWEIADESEEQTCFDIIYYFVTYTRKA